MPSFDLRLSTLRAAYRAKATTPAKLIGELREKAAALDAEFHLFIHLLSDAEIAPYLDALEGHSPDSLPLYGVPFAIKDNIDLAGIPTTAACPAFAYTPGESATLVAQLIALGAVPIGKANLDQFATGLNGTRSPYGKCRNSVHPDYPSGGSSAGSALAVALGVASFALGTDTAGSGRVPAALNNLVGLKATKGLLSTAGVVPACRTLDCVTYFTATAREASELLALTGPSGSGKSTLLRCIAGLERGAVGHIECSREVWLDSRLRVNARPQQRSVGLVFQQYALFPHMTALENVEAALGHRPRQVRRDRWTGRRH